MRPIDPEILANRARLDMELDALRESRAHVTPGRWIVRCFLATILVIMVCNLFT